jgi:hypothetical protein
LKRLQDDLGYANDVRVASDILAELSSRAATSSPVASAGTGLLRWHQKALAQRERKLRKRMRRLNRAEPFWRG